MAATAIRFFVLYAALSRDAEGQSDEVIKQVYNGKAMAKFVHAGTLSSPSSIVIANRGPAVTPKIGIAAGANFPLKQPSMPTAMLKTLAELKETNQETKIKYQHLRARVEKLPPVSPKDSRQGFGFGAFMGFVASVGLVTSIGIATTRTHFGQRHRHAESMSESQMSLAPQRAGPIVASCARGGNVYMDAIANDLKDQAEELGPSPLTSSSIGSNDRCEGISMPVNGLSEILPILAQASSSLVRQGISAALSLLLLTYHGPTPGGTSLCLPLPVQPASAKELSPEQMLVAEAWQVTDKQFVDRSFAGQDWFKRRQTMVKKSYVDREAAYDEIRAMLASLGDRYTRFLTPAMFESIYSIATGSSAGIGCELNTVVRDPTDPTSKDTVSFINQVFVGSPAEKAGLKAGDIIVEVDGFGVLGQSREEVAGKVRGPADSKVRLTVTRKGQDEPLVKIITRAEFKLESVTSSLQDGPAGNKVGIVRISQFSTTTAADVAAALEQLKAKRAAAFVVDLRGDSGGYFPGGVDVARLFLPAEKPITYVVDKRNQTTTYATYVDGAYTNEPLLLLVDGNTASASEIFSSALQDNKRATLVGGKTFGKAVIQTVEKLSDGSAVNVTGAKYQTPNGSDINGKGITPEVFKECPQGQSEAVQCVQGELAKALST